MPQHAASPRTYRILVINPGSNSTKISVFENGREVNSFAIEHSPEIIKTFSSAVYDQYDYRMQCITEGLAEHQVDLGTFDAIVGRGGFIPPVPSGAYRVTDQMVEDLKHPWSEHVANLGGIIAKALADPQGIPAYIVDPVCVDEMESIARVSGFDGFERRPKWQPLSHKATARRLASDLGRPYNELRIITGHLGGGITVGAHVDGRVIDVNNGLDGDGPFSADRPGTLPLCDVVSYCFDHGFTKEQVVKTFISKGGLYSYFQTVDLRQIETQANGGDEKANLVLDAMAYQIAKEIGAMATVLEGRVDGIALTGGIAHSGFVVPRIVERVRFIAPVHVYPGSLEMEALALGALRDLTGEEPAKDYQDVVLRRQ